MKKILVLILIISIVSFIFTIFNFLASTDISHDYLSKKVLISENINTKTIPEWTDCKREWSILQIDFITTIILIALLIKKSKNQRAQI